MSITSPYARREKRFCGSIYPLPHANHLSRTIEKSWGWLLHLPRSLQKHGVYLTDSVGDFRCESVYILK
ncbi:MAG: hypothetical protein D6743_09985 [Calditrichaeota bacterium]|nr:MAG: hypothetical protein D6743_09985 [Calditrichota bacterium]